MKTYYLLPIGVTRVIRGYSSALRVVKNYMRGWLAHFKLGAHVLDLRCLLFESGSDNFHPFLELANSEFLLCSIRF